MQDYVYVRIELCKCQPVLFASYTITKENLKIFVNKLYMYMAASGCSIPK